MKNLFLTDTGKRFSVALLLSDKDTGHIMWQNFVNSYQIYKKDRETMKNQI